MGNHWPKWSDHFYFAIRVILAKKGNEILFFFCIFWQKPHFQKFYLQNAWTNLSPPHCIRMIIILAFNRKKKQKSFWNRTEYIYKSQIRLRFFRNMVNIKKKIVCWSKIKILWRCKKKLVQANFSTLVNKVLLFITVLSSMLSTQSILMET